MLQSYQLSSSVWQSGRRDAGSPDNGGEGGGGTGQGHRAALGHRLVRKLAPLDHDMVFIHHDPSFQELVVQEVVLLCEDVHVLDHHSHGIGHTGLLSHGSQNL